MKKIVSAFLALMLVVLPAMPVYAADTASSKEEAVYGILKTDGSVDSIYVVNSFRSGNVKDFGKYTKLQNLTNGEKLSQNGEEITIHTSAEKLYYQGTLETKELPWSTAIQYSLDGKEISGTELAGKNGALQIKIKVTKNPSVNPTFFNNYALQIGVKLDTNRCDNIVTANATVAQAGSDKQLNYTVLPGNEADITVTANVKDFEMEAITINGIKLSMNMSIDNAGMQDQVNQLVDAIKQLDTGAGDLSGGAARLSDGMKQYIAGLKAFSDGLSKLNSGVGELNNGALSLKDGLSELTKQNSSLMNGALAIQQSAFAAVNSQLAGTGLPVITPENYKTLLGGNPDFAEALAQLEGAVQFTQGLKGYTEGVAQLKEGAAGLADGTTQLKASVSTLATSAQELYNGGAEINKAISKLRDGLSSYKKGTAELRGKTANLSTDMTEQINDIMDSISGNGDGVTSFVSEKNENVTAVQFVLKTTAVEKPEPAAPVKTEPAKKSFWQKLLALFGIK
ncbi:MAG: hypothetical protein BGN88_10330 [Clostridiales bacterium 43-6]|nr:MAG: hypothetical protein BGN88_10330 [Clostridiales bacterium 43-6]